jgi:hypothetical protein
VKDDTVYSTPWNPVNIIANIIVNTKPYKLPFLLPCINEWCAYVTVTPEDNRIIVFNNGNSKGFIACIPNGGHCAPTSTSGLIAL